MLVRSLPMKSPKRMACDVYIFVTHPGFVYDVIDRLQGAKLKRTWLSFRNFKRRLLAKRTQNGSRNLFVSILVGSLGLVMPL